MKKKKTAAVDATTRGSLTGASVALEGVNNFEVAPKVYTHPVDLDYYVRKLKDCPYLPLPDIDDIVSALIVRTAYRRREWPGDSEWQKRFLEIKDKYLAAKLEDVAGREAWLDIQQARDIDPETGERFESSFDDEEIEEDGLVPAPNLGKAKGPRPGALGVYGLPDELGIERNLIAESIAMTIRTLPRLRSLGLMYLEEKEAAAAPKPDMSGDDSGGGRKAKPKMTASHDEEPDAPIVLSEDEMEALGITLG